MLKKKNILSIIVLLFVLNIAGYAVDKYTIVLSPIYKNNDYQLYVNALSVYGQSLQHDVVGNKLNNKIIKPTGYYSLKTKVVLVATVKKNGQYCPNAKLLWNVNNITNEYNNVLTGSITNWGEKKDSKFTGNAVITSTFYKPHKIYVQTPLNRNGIPIGSGYYKTISLLPGQSYIELTSTIKGQTDISVSLWDETNPNRNLVFATIKWINPIKPALDLSLEDSGDIIFLSRKLPSNFFLKQEKYIATFKATAALKSSVSYSDFLTIQLPEGWDFKYNDKKSASFVNNFTLIKNGQKIPNEQFKKIFKLTTGSLNKNSVFTKNFVTISLKFEPGDKYIFAVKSRPSENLNPTEMEGAKIYNATVMLNNLELLTQDPITLKHGYDSLITSQFSDLEVNLKDENDPVILSEDKYANYKLTLKNQGIGKINIKNIKILSALVPMDSNLKLADGTVVTDYLSKEDKTFSLVNYQSANLYFKVPVDKSIDVLKVNFKIFFEMEKKSADKIKKIEGTTIVNEYTTVYK